MHLSSLTLTDYRNFGEATLVVDPAGTTVVRGPNGAGKTNLLEAIGYLATLRSFRGAPREAMVRRGADSAVLRAEAQAGTRSLVVEAEIVVSGRSRLQVNRQSVRRRRDLHDALRCTVFSPHDISIVSGGPAERRSFLDETLDVVDPKLSQDGDDMDRVLRQRNALLRDAHHRPRGEVASSLDVWDQRLAEVGTRVAETREQLLEAVHPRLEAHYDRLAGKPSSVTARYVRSWHGLLDEALVGHRDVDLARGTTSVGPHRDDVELLLGELPARTQASQGEQRSLALALRLAGHQLATERLGEAPILLLDDVFSELDPGRRRGLMEGLPSGQALVTTAVEPPAEVTVARIVEVVEGRVLPMEPE